VEFVSVKFVACPYCIVLLHTGIAKHFGGTYTAHYQISHLSATRGQILIIFLLIIISLSLSENFGIIIIEHDMNPAGTLLSFLLHFTFPVELQLFRN